MYLSAAVLRADCCQAYLPGTGSSTSYLARSLGSKDLHDKLRPVGSVRGRDHPRDLHDERLLQESRASQADYPHYRKLDWAYDEGVSCGHGQRTYDVNAMSEPPAEM